MIEIVRARPADAAVLSELARAAKAHWGYPARWLEEWRDLLTVTSALIEKNETFKALLNEQPIGFYAVAVAGSEGRLEHLWVLPERIGQGVGRALFHHAAARAASLGVACLTIESDPQAEGFYLRLGAVRVGTAPSEVAGQRRELPLLEFPLARPFA